MSVLLELPRFGDVTVYGDFAANNPYGFGVQTTISYTTTGGFLPPFSLADQNNTFAEITINVHVNTANILVYGCNGFEGGYHCGQANQVQPYTSVSSLDGLDGILHVSSYVQYYAGGHYLDTLSPSDPMFVNLHIFATMPDGFTLAPPVPEPATWAMLLIGFACVSLVSFHRKRKFNEQLG